MNGSMGILVEYITIKTAIKRDIDIPRVKRELRQRIKPWPAPEALDAELMRIRDLDDEKLVAKLRTLLPDSMVEEEQEWPVVKFTNDRIILCIPEEFTAHDAHGNIQAQRCQVTFRSCFT